MVAAATGLGALALSAAVFLTNLSSRNEDIAVRLQGSTTAVQRALDQHIDGVTAYGAQPAEVRAQVPALRAEVARQRTEIARLRAQVERLDRRTKPNAGVPVVLPQVP